MPDTCAPVPAADCRATGRGKASLRLPNLRRDARDRLDWTWASGPPLLAGDLGGAPTASDYLLCVYADDRLVLSALAPQGARSAGKPCWRATKHRFKYRNKELTPDGLSTIVLRTGKVGRIIVKGKGANLAMPTLPLTTPVTLQLRRTDGGPCWESTIETPLVNSTTQFGWRSRSTTAPTTTSSPPSTTIVPTTTSSSTSTTIAPTTTSSSTSTTIVPTTTSSSTSTTIVPTTTSSSTSTTIVPTTTSSSTTTTTTSTTTTTTSPGASCPCTIWSPTQTPAVASQNDASAVEVAVKFRSDLAGVITGLRFYKGSKNTGTHVGNLWTTSGQLLATVTFTGETASGWQQANFNTPVQIAPNTMYVASYHTTSGFYSADAGYFTSKGVDTPPLHALANSVSPNGVYQYGPGGFPTSTFNATNYWVDAVFNPSGPNTTPPTVAGTSPPNGAAGENPATPVTVTFSEAMDPTTISTASVELRDATNSLVSAAVTYDVSSFTATLQPSSPLTTSAFYTLVVHGGTTTDPRVKDLAGNALAANFTSSFSTATTTTPPPPGQGPGGPLLVITSAQNPFSTYYAEILSAEGLNLFSVADISTVTPSVLAAYDVAILGDMPLTAPQVTMLSNWVTSGGNLVAMHPDRQLASLLGLTAVGTTLSNAYLQVNTATPPGAGIVGQTIQFHGPADRYTLNGATAVATLFSSATTGTSNPAVTMRSVGTLGGQAAAFTYDLARSVVYTRQGNPAWAGMERDGTAPIRSDDMFFGPASFDVEPNWINLTKVAIPQADEQQRLLANLILLMNADRKPLPRFWYLPRGLKAVVVMTGDDHANGGTQGRFDQYIAASPQGCSVENWECIRSTSYVYVNSILTDAIASSYNAKGFEVGLHVFTGCADWTLSSLANFFNSQLATFQSTYPSVPAPVTNRTHCTVWSDWSTQATIEVSHNMGLDTNYYYWPPSWVNNVPGLFTGSGMPMRFADSNGNLIDIYQATTQMTDESGQTFPFTIDTLLNNALGSQGYYGVFTANMHTDSVASSGSDAIVASAQAHGVPIVSSRQMLTWLDGRNGSSFGAITWDGTTLGFNVNVGIGANGLQAMVPAQSGTKTLTGVAQNGTRVPFTLSTLKGVQWATFAAGPGAYQATYAGQTA